MGLLEIFLVSIGLAMDAFAAAVCEGLKMKQMYYPRAVITALFFGGFQAVMPLVGWLLGKRFSIYIMQVDHWIAFILLIVIGGNMIRNGLKEGGEETQGCKVKGNVPMDGIDFKELVMLAIATSIDALAVGVMIAFVKVSIGWVVCMVGIITFIISFLGVSLGRFFGSKYRNKAEIAGGIVLVLIGFKILLWDFFF